MKYLGGKNQIRHWIRESVLARVVRRDRYVEPFVGSAAVWMELAPRFRDARGSDAMIDLVLYLNAIRGGWVPPEKVPEEVYYEMQAAPPSALRGHVGFNCSWGGMWFRGYGSYEDRDVQGSRVSAKMGRRLRSCPAVSLGDYREVEVLAGDVVYCDPPYGGTEPYRWLPERSFDSYEFWAVMARWVRVGATVLVSEERAPANWVAVAETSRKALAAYRAGDGRLDRRRVERLFQHESQVTERMILSRHRRNVVSWPAIE